jgi:hypothetical protein
MRGRRIVVGKEVSFYIFWPFLPCFTGYFTELSLPTSSTICEISQTEKGFSYHFQLFTITLVYCFISKGSLHTLSKRKPLESVIIFSILDTASNKKAKYFSFLGLCGREGFSCHFSFIRIPILTDVIENN